jgi:hypothetical protein
LDLDCSKLEARRLKGKIKVRDWEQFVWFNKMQVYLKKRTIENYSV